MEDHDSPPSQIRRHLMVVIMMMMMMVKVIGLLTRIVDLDHPAGCNGLIALSLCLFTLLIGPTPPKAPRLLVLGFRQERYMDEFQCDGSHLSTYRFESSTFRKMSEEFTKVSNQCLVDDSIVWRGQRSQNKQ